MVVHGGVGFVVSLVRLHGRNRAAGCQYDGEKNDPRQIRDEAQAQPLIGFQFRLLLA